MAKVIVQSGEFENEVKDLLRRVKNFRTPLRAWGLHMVGSVKRNFQEQGRPDPWRPLKVNTLIARYLRGKAKVEKSSKFAPNSHVFKEDRGRLGAGDVGAVSTVDGFLRSSRTGRVLRSRHKGLNKIAQPGYVFRKPALRAILQGKILLDTGRLRKSVTSQVTGTNDVEIGSNVVYAGTHQRGNSKKGIPPRPFLIIQPDDEEEFTALLTDWVLGGERF